MEVPPETQTAVNDTNTVISAANLLMVALLKLNRVFIPPLLRLARSRRVEWIRRSSRDVAKSIRENPDDRTLCRGSCCRDTYLVEQAELQRRLDRLYALDPVMLDLWLDNPVMPDTQPPPPPPTNAPPAASTTTGTPAQPDAPPTEQPPVEQDPPPAQFPSLAVPLLPAASPRPAQSQLAPSPLTDDEAYFRLRVLQEERHRSTRVLLFSYTSVMTSTVTAITLTIYSIIIISLVLRFATLDRRESLIFAFSLIATATISEAETLMRNRRRRAIRPPNPSGEDQVSARAVVSTTQREPSAPVTSPAAPTSATPGANEGVASALRLQVAPPAASYALPHADLNTMAPEVEDLSDLEA